MRFRLERRLKLNKRKLIIANNCELSVFCGFVIKSVFKTNLNTYHPYKSLSFIKTN